MIFSKLANIFNRSKTVEVASSQLTSDLLHEKIQALKSNANEFLAKGKLPEAIATYERIVDLTPQDCSAYIALGYAQFESDSLSAAKASFTRALALDGKSVDAHFLMGQLLAREVLPKQALQSFKAAVALKPDFAFAWLELARTQESLGDLGAALNSYATALTSDPGNQTSGEARTGKARVLLGLERWQDALDAITQQSASSSQYMMAVYQSLALQRLKRNDEALAVIDELLLLQPTLVEALQVKGTVLTALGRHGEALPVYEKAIAIDPKFAAALSDAGAIYAKAGQFDHALALYAQAIQSQPNHADALYNRCTAYLHMGRCDDAIIAANAALDIYPDHADVHWVKAAALLRSGQFEEGWAEYEWRWRAKLLGSNLIKPEYPQPMWTGQPIDGKTIWLYAEQGLGDTLQLLRYIRLLIARGAVVLLTAQEPIYALRGSLQDNCIWLEPGQVVPAFDYHCPLFSLPLAFKTNLGTIPEQVPYLRSEPDLQKFWEQKLGATSFPRVGLVWSGNTAFQNDEKRSIALATLVAALPPRIGYISLQKEVRPSDQEALAQSNVFDASQDIKTFADTAALIACTDLVISVDTSVAHLAGAMAKPLWVLLPHSPDWRWMMHRIDSPWYPTARLFRQQVNQSWDPLVSQVCAELALLRG